MIYRRRVFHTNVFNSRSYLQSIENDEKYSRSHLIIVVFIGNHINNYCGNSFNAYTAAAEKLNPALIYSRFEILKNSRTNAAKYYVLLFFENFLF